MNTTVCYGAQHAHFQHSYLKVPLYLSGGNAMKGKTLGILALLIVVIGIILAVYISNSAHDNAVWQTAGEISGKGKQDTTEFNVSNKWRIIWKIDNDTYDFLVAVYIKDSSGYSVVDETYAADVNSTIGVIPVDYTGSFIIRVVTSDDIAWSLTIQEFTKPT